MSKYVPPKRRWTSTELHGITLQEKAFFIITGVYKSQLSSMNWIAHITLLTHEGGVLKSQVQRKHVVMIYVKSVLLTHRFSYRCGAFLMVMIKIRLVAPTLCDYVRHWLHRKISSEQLHVNVGSVVLKAVFMKSTIFWDITPCSPLEVNRRFGGTYSRHLQGRISRARYQRE
jgi:hypothetical protein